MSLDLLATPSTALLAAAQAQFGAAKGAGVASAIHRRAVRDGIFAPAELGLSARACAEWQRMAQLQLPQVVHEANEPTPTGLLTKRLLRLADGAQIECVLLPMGRQRHSLCLSTQVGCARACVFCSTGRMGLRRNLSCGEIIAQLTLVHRQLRPDSLVFQGMGEPLDNLAGLLPALQVLTDRRGLAYAQEQLTICTIGHLPGIAALRELGWKRLGLALSLHAAEDQQRRELLPHAARYPLAEIQQALIDYRQRRNLTLHIHWCLLPGINDRPGDAAAIAAFCRPLGRCLIHVIPYNPDDQPMSRAPEEVEIVRFVELLRGAGLAVRRRITKGRSVLAACGQLAGRSSVERSGVERSGTEDRAGISDRPS